MGRYYYLDNDSIACTYLCCIATSRLVSVLVTVTTSCNRDCDSVSVCDCETVDMTVTVRFQAVCGQGREQAGDGPSVANIDVQCQKTGMQVQIEFSERFDGIIFSKGHFADPNCR